MKHITIDAFVPYRLLRQIESAVIKAAKAHGIYGDLYADGVPSIGSQYQQLLKITIFDDVPRYLRRTRVAQNLVWQLVHALVDSHLEDDLPRRDTPPAVARSIRQASANGRSKR